MSSIIIVLSGSRLGLTQAYMPCERGLRSESFIADIVLDQATYRESCFRMKGLEGPQYYHYQSWLGVKTLFYLMFLVGTC